MRLRNYTSLALEVLIAALTVVPILILVYFYSTLPENIPVFLNLRGEVEVWAAKSVVAVFRVPAMAIDLQLICLLMKYGTVKSRATFPATNRQAYLRYQERTTVLSTRFWDWLRCLVAFKMSAESLDVLFIGDERLRSFRTMAWAVTWIAAILSLVVALVYGYRLLLVKREMKEALVFDYPEEVKFAHAGKEADKAHLRGGFLYFNVQDPAMFVPRYVFNFANKWVYVLLVSIAVYPLLVFSPL